MQVLRIKNTADGLRLARCLVGAPTVYNAHSLAAIVPKVGSNLDRPDSNQGEDRSFHGPFGVLLNSEYVYFTDGIDLPIETLKLDPFAAMREDIPVVIDGYTDDGAFYKFQTKIDFIFHHTDQWGNKIFCIGCEDMNGENNEFAIGGSMSSEIILDLEAAALLDGVTVEEI